MKAQFLIHNDAELGMICDEFGVNVMKYELRTLKDVFDKVPIDRIGDCMKEIGIAMIQVLIPFKSGKS
jgi:hypothetical protein